MWLLSTDRAELQFFPTVEAAQQQVYAILSHVWDASGEQTFQQTQELRAQCQRTGAIPRDLSSPKVRESCMIAGRHGYQWIWNDTCCIDKTSSADLSEAINSMYVYYARAEVCYAYLADVPNVGDTDEHDALFRRSRWHTRGWTLQELIVPDVVVFLSAQWKVMGTKADRAALLQEITAVPATILRLEEEIRNISVARRLSWAAAQVTTRPEDEAYCMMGIFEINMPTLYGEGRNAFQRLQEEIMRKNIDTTLFAWGDVDHKLPSTIDPWDRLDYPEMYLFAPSPEQFGGSSKVEFSPRAMQKLGGSFTRNSQPVDVSDFRRPPKSRVAECLGVRMKELMRGYFHHQSQMKAQNKPLLYSLYRMASMLNVAPRMRYSSLPISIFLCLHSAR